MREEDTSNIQHGWADTEDAQLQQMDDDSQCAAKLVKLRAEVARLTGELEAVKDKYVDDLNKDNYTYNSKTNALIKRHSAQLAAAKLEGFNEGIEEVARFFDGAESGGTGGLIRVLKREVV